MTRKQGYVRALLWGLLSMLFFRHAFIDHIGDGLGLFLSIAFLVIVIGILLFQIHADRDAQRRN